MSRDFDALGHARAVVENQQRLRANLARSYDFIVCGAGSAGCVVAARLAEQEDVQVLLLERAATTWWRRLPSQRNGC